MKDANELLKRISKALSGGDITPEGKGWKTVKDWAETWAIHPPRASALLAHGLKVGIMEREKGKRDGRLVVYYREKKP